MDQKMRLLTVEELTELAEIRKKMDALQARYDQLTSKLDKKKATAPAGQVASQGQKMRVEKTPEKSPAKEPEKSHPTVPGDVPATGPAKATQTEPHRVPPCEPGKKTLKESVRDALLKSGKPVSFDEIYRQLEANGAPLPADKPKLALRKVLYNRQQFKVENGRFTLK